MDYNLIKIRVASFLTGLLTLIVGAVLTAIFSVFTGPDFHALVTQHFGEGAVASLIFLVVQQAVAHVRNLTVLAKYHVALGGGDSPKPPVLI